MPSGKKPLTDILTEEELDDLEEKYKTCTCIADIMPITGYGYDIMRRYFGSLKYKEIYRRKQYIPTIKKNEINYRW